MKKEFKQRGSNKPKIHKGIFGYLHNRGLTVQEMYICLRAYARIHLNIDYMHSTLWFSATQAHIHNDFKPFKRYVKKTYVNSHLNIFDDSWNDWNEKNLDGTFAYNGVTDDF